MITELAPTAIARDASAFIGRDSLGRLFVHGGSDTTELAAERYDPVLGTWETLASAFQYQQQGAQFLDISDRYYNVGGQLVGLFGNGGTPRGQVYDPATNSWAYISNMAPMTWLDGFDYWNGPLSFYWHGDPITGEIWVLGGIQETGQQDYFLTNGHGFPPPPYFSQMYVMDGGHYTGGPSGTWDRRTAAFAGCSAPEPNGGGFYNNIESWRPITDSQGRMYLIGWQASSTTCTIASGMWRYSTAADSWENLPGPPVLVGGALSDRGKVLVADDDSLWAVGGMVGIAGCNVARFDPLLGTWTTLSTDGPFVAPTSLIQLDRQLVVFGTHSGPGGGTTYQNAIWVYGMDTLTWTQSEDLLLRFDAATSTYIDILIPGPLITGNHGVYIIGGYDTSFTRVTNVKFWSYQSRRGSRSFAQVIG